MLEQYVLRTDSHEPSCVQFRQKPTNSLKFDADFCHHPLRGKFLRSVSTSNVLLLKINCLVFKFGKIIDKDAWKSPVTNQ